MTWDDLTDRLVSNGSLSSSWEPVFRRVPRSNFLPDVVYPRWDGDRVDRTTDPDQWQDLADTDVPLVTQFNEGRDDDSNRTPTSSSSMPTVVAQLASQLGDIKGLDLLDVGTGTGWTTALAMEAGANVTSVEVDETVGSQAAERLTALGYQPRLIVADGMEAVGDGDQAFDRIHCTTAVRRIPPAWIRQVRPGGVIVTPFGTPYCNGAGLRLEVQDDGSASGRFNDNVSFMWSRTQRPTHRPIPDDSDFRYRPSIFDPADLNHAASFAIGLHIPGLRTRELWYDPIKWASGMTHVWNQDSSAHCRYADWDAPHAVTQTGPADLWTQIENAFTSWRDAGSPGLDRIGLTVEPDGTHRAWVDSPDRPWRIDAGD